MIKFLKKYHKWISIVFAILVILFTVSGIVLNHRLLLSEIDLDRDILPDNYEYNNWNNAAVKSTLKITPDSIFIYGNIGIWLTNENMSVFTDFNTGFPKGVDNQKVCKVFATNKGKLLAGTLFGLYDYSREHERWRKIELPIHENRIVDITQKNDTLLILSRSHIIKTVDLINFEKFILPPPEDYDNKVGLFKTLWVIHSGEIYGETGKIIVDILGLILAFITISGFIIFINRVTINKRKKSGVSTINKLRVNKTLLRWHNKLGWIALVFLIITSATGIFLRPPFLIPIANSKVSKIPFSELDTNNPWFDQLRRIIYDEEINRYIIATSEGIFYSDDNFKSELKAFEIQPPVSVMGVNVFRKYYSNTYLIGSFNGLFVWNTQNNRVFDYIKKENYRMPKQRSRPIGEFMVTGFSNDFGEKEIFFDYNTGAQSIGNAPFVKMPKSIKEQAISLWNVALEIHTGRIFQSILGVFYILIVPSTGLALLFIIISGFIVWWKLYRNKL